MAVEKHIGNAEPGHANEQWSAVARQWRLMGQPLRPTDQDLDYAMQAITAWGNTHGVPRALILGVTPEFYHLSWPAGAEVIAVDHTQLMIDAVWPGPKEAAHCAEWTNMPLPDTSRDIVMCDGGLILLPYPEGQRAFVREVNRVMAPDGLCMLRLFVPPEHREEPGAVIKDLLESRIANLNLLKLRLGMAMQKDVREGIQPHAVWQVLNDAVQDFGQLAQRIGWPLEQLQAIDAYRGRKAPYHFMTTDEVVSLFCEDDAGFTLESTFQPSYELGERCPTLVFRKL